MGVALGEPWRRSVSWTERLVTGVGAQLSSEVPLEGVVVEEVATGCSAGE